MAEVFRLQFQPVPGALAMLQRLEGPYCVATNGPCAKTELTLSITGLLPLLQDRIFSAYEVGMFKPNPVLFPHAARSMGVEPERCLVVEDDRAIGVRTGLAAGMHVCVLHSTQPLSADLRDRVRHHSMLEKLLYEPLDKQQQANAFQYSQPIS